MRTAKTDLTGRTPRQICFRWAQPLCWFCRVAAHVTDGKVHGRIQDAFEVVKKRERRW